LAALWLAKAGEAAANAVRKTIMNTRIATTTRVPTRTHRSSELLAVSAVAHLTLAVGLGAGAGNPMRLALAAALLVAAQAASAQDAIVYPDSTLTTGAIRTTNVGEICSTDTRTLRHGSRERSELIYERYHIAPADRMNYTLDHLIPLEIGGADVVDNVWPEPRRSLAGEWDDTRKDELELRLGVLVCNGELDVREAQKAIADDWTEAWKLAFGRCVGPLLEPFAGMGKHGRVADPGHDGLPVLSFLLRKHRRGQSRHAAWVVRSSMT
jgi:hypothetical protein